MGQQRHGPVYADNRDRGRQMLAGLVEIGVILSADRARRELDQVLDGADGLGSEHDDATNGQDEVHDLADAERL